MFLSSKTAHPSSHIWPNDISDELSSFGSIEAILASFDNRVYNGICPFSVDDINSLFGKISDGPIYFSMSSKAFLSRERQ